MLCITEWTLCRCHQQLSSNAAGTWRQRWMSSCEWLESREFSSMHEHHLWPSCDGLLPTRCWFLRRVINHCSLWCSTALKGAECEIALNARFYSFGLCNNYAVFTAYVRRPLKRNFLELDDPGNASYRMTLWTVIMLSERMPIFCHIYACQGSCVG